MAIGYFAIFLLLSVTQCSGQRVVETNVGSFRGANADDGNYFQFLGIPYGRVDAANPFGASSPYPTIEGVYNANDDSVICPQISGTNNTVIGSLDCLRLNIYMPSSASATNRLPVMVYIHGGFLARGFATKAVAGPKFLVRHDVIIVTVQYRLGPYGFMCLNRRAVPGNQGLKDQYMALEWIRDNIQAFGGNSNQVTLFGQSAGAHSIDLHLLSKKEKLYNNVILQSGSSVATTVLFEPDREAPMKIASYLGLPADGNREALDSLRNANVVDVMRAATSLNLDFKPCPENEFEDVDAFITESWIKAPVPKAQGLPILIGFAEYERLMAHISGDSQHFEGLTNIFFNNLNQTFNFDDDKIDKMQAYARKFYIGDTPLSPDVAWPIINFQSDYWYNHPIQRSIKKFLESGAANIFYYMFSYSGDRNFVALNNLTVRGAAHSDDLFYIFDMAALPQQISDQDQLTIDRVTTMWTNFAKYSDPIPQTTTLLPIRWTPLTNDIYHCLKIDSNLTMERRPFNKRMAFWDLFYVLNRDYQKTLDAIDPAEDDVNSSTGLTSSLLNMAFSLLLLAAYRG